MRKPFVQFPTITGLKQGNSFWIKSFLSYWYWIFTLCSRQENLFFSANAFSLSYHSCFVYKTALWNLQNCTKILFLLELILAEVNITGLESTNKQWKLQWNLPPRHDCPQILIFRNSFQSFSLSMSLSSSTRHSFIFFPWQWRNEVLNFTVLSL